MIIVTTSESDNDPLVAVTFTRYVPVGVLFVAVTVKVARASCPGIPARKSVVELRDAESPCLRVGLTTIERRRLPLNPRMLAMDIWEVVEKRGIVWGGVASPVPPVRILTLTGFAKTAKSLTTITKSIE